MAHENTKTVHFDVEDNFNYIRLDAFLHRQLPWRSRTGLVALIQAGAALVNGKPSTTKARRLRGGDRVSLEVPSNDRAIIAATRKRPLDILYEDQELVVVNKPEDLAVHPASTCLHDNLLERLKYRYAAEQIEPDAELCILHRLDRGTSGVIALAKKKHFAGYYAAQFAARTPKKTYLAIVQGRLQGQGRIESPIKVEPQKPVYLCPSGKSSRTDYHVLEALDTVSLVQLALYTGRKHQIRAHMASLGHPIVHDGVYGIPQDRNTHSSQRLSPLLHAAKLCIRHRVHGTMSFEAPMRGTMLKYWTDAKANQARCG